MISIGSLVLSDHLTLDPETITWTGLHANVERTIGGNLVIYEGYAQGLPVTLVATESSGWLTYAQVKELLNMASVMGATYIVTFEDKTFSVRFRNEDSPAVDVVAVTPRPNTGPDDIFTGKIKLIEV